MELSSRLNALWPRSLVLGDVDPLEFSGRLSVSDFTDPAGG
jgi:hypothetical protein